jgi:hypothetical protein
MEIAALIAAALIGLLILFQIALALGAPWGRAAWGGGHEGKLPPKLRLASAISTLVLALAAWVVLAAGGLIDSSPVPESWLTPLVWVLTGYFGIGAVLNIISRSKVERIWGPVSLIIAVCCGLVAAA